MSRFRLRSFLPRGKVLLASIAALVVLSIVFLLLASFFRFDIEIDVAAILKAFALAVVAVTVFHVVRHWLKPKQTVSVGYHVKLDQPMMPVLGRYSFRLEVFYEVEEKGERARIDQGTIELRFRKADHPDMLEWCCARIAEHLDKHAGFASEKYPGARILLPPEPTPRLIESEAVTDADSG